MLPLHIILVIFCAFKNELPEIPVYTYKNVSCKNHFFNAKIKFTLVQYITKSGPNPPKQNMTNMRTDFNIRNSLSGSLNLQRTHFIYSKMLRTMFSKKQNKKTNKKTTHTQIKVLHSIQFTSLQFN